MYDMCTACICCISVIYSLADACNLIRFDNEFPSQLLHFVYNTLLIAMATGCTVYTVEELCNQYFKLP